MTTEIGHIGLRVLTELEDRWLPAGAIARLRLEQSAAGPVAREETRRSVPVPIGEKAPPAVIDLPAGHWSIDVDMPSGLRIQTEVDVIAGRHVPLDLTMDYSPYETLRWQHLSGSVTGYSRFQAAPDAEPAAVVEAIEEQAEAERTYPDIVRQDRLITRLRAGLTDSGQSGLRGIRQVLAQPDFDLNDVSFNILETAIGRLADEMEPEQARITWLRPEAPWELWSLFLGARDGLAGYDPKESMVVVGEHDPLDIKTLYTTQSVHEWLEQHGAEFPRWLMVEVFGERRMLCVPASWSTPSGDKADVEILIRFLKTEESLAEFTIKDETALSMLSYLRRDKLDEAGMLAGEFREWLFYKIMNPFAAAAGGYALLATRLHGDDTTWHQWIRNLDNWFEWLPDGAILEGFMRLNGPKQIRDFDKAAKCFEKAFHRGPPVYTLGVSWLRSGLDTLKADHANLREPAEIVGRVARMVEMKQVFTSLRLPGEGGT